MLSIIICYQSLILKLKVFGLMYALFQKVHILGTARLNLRTCWSHFCMKIFIIYLPWKKRLLKQMIFVIAAFDINMATLI